MANGQPSTGELVLTLVLATAGTALSAYGIYYAVVALSRPKPQPVG